MFIAQSSDLTINASNINVYNGKTILVSSVSGGNNWTSIKLDDLPANFGPCDFWVMKDDETSKPVKIEAPNIGGTLYPIGELSFVGLVGNGESAHIAIDSTGIRVIGSGCPIQGREFHRTFVPTSVANSYQIEWWVRNGILRVNCAVNNQDAMIVLPDPTTFGFPAPSYGRSFRLKIVRPDFGSTHLCSVFSTTGFVINNRPQTTPTPVGAGEVWEFDFDNAQWWASKGAYA